MQSALRNACECLRDQELEVKLNSLAKQERETLVELLIPLAEFDKRRLYAEREIPSLFVYCTKILGYSEAEAYLRIRSARAGRGYPIILELLSSKRLTMTAIAMLTPHLNDANHRTLLEEACGKNKIALEMMLARLEPRHIERDLIRPLGPESMSLPAANEISAPASQATCPEKPEPKETPEKLEPRLPQRIRFSFTGGEELLTLVRRAQEVLKHKYPAGDLEFIIAEALEGLLDRKDPERRLRRKEGVGRLRPLEPSPKEENPFLQPRRVPQAVRDAVWRRDGGQCVYRGPGRERCPERGGLEFDHIVPWALGGPSNNPKNLRLLCKAHNLMMARRVFGEAAWPRDLSRRPV